MINGDKIPSNFQFSGLTLKGIPKKLRKKTRNGLIDRLLYNPILEFVVTATDPLGKSVAQILPVKVNADIIFVINSIAKQIGLIVTIFGLIKYQAWLFEIFCKNKY